MRFVKFGGGLLIQCELKSEPVSGQKITYYRSRIEVCSVARWFPCIPVQLIQHRVIEVRIKKRIERPS